MYKMNSIVSDDGDEVRQCAQCHMVRDERQKIIRKHEET